MYFSRLVCEFDDATATVYIMRMTMMTMMTIVYKWFYDCDEHK